jgi:hypothetical protein
MEITTNLHTTTSAMCIRTYTSFGGCGHTVITELKRCPLAYYMSVVNRVVILCPVMNDYSIPALDSGDCPYEPSVDTPKSACSGWIRWKERSKIRLAQWLKSASLADVRDFWKSAGVFGWTEIKGVYLVANFAKIRQTSGWKDRVKGLKMSAVGMEGPFARRRSEGDVQEIRELGQAQLFRTFGEKGN